MSHEGFRIGPKDERARIVAEEEVTLPLQATTPRSVRVNKTGGTGMEIDWQDGHRSAWSFGWLRDACPCATCNEEREHHGREPGQPKPAQPSLLPMYKEPPRPEEVTAVGKYAISFKWNDGHQHGIYSWDFLRKRCQCGECRRV